MNKHWPEHTNDIFQNIIRYWRLENPRVNAEVDIFFSYLASCVTGEGGTTTTNLITT